MEQIIQTNRDTTAQIITWANFNEKKVKELREEIKELKEEINHKNNKFSEWIEENKELKDQIDDAVENHFADLKLRETTHKEWDTLKQENNKLKSEKQIALVPWLGDDWDKTTLAGS